MNQESLLFLCTGNSCRSQMAEAWARKLAPEIVPGVPLRFQSAGLEAHGLNSRAVESMQRQGIDISTHTSDVVTDEMIQTSTVIVTVCSHADNYCPVVPGNKRKIHIPFVDPARATGTNAEIDSVFNRVCLDIKKEIESLLLDLAASVN